MLDAPSALDTTPNSKVDPFGIGLPTEFWKAGVDPARLLKETFWAHKIPVGRINPAAISRFFMISFYKTGAGRVAILPVVDGFQI
jgi:hypothetical protein